MAKRETGRFENLPKWAQDEMTALQRENARLREQLAQAQAQPTDHAITPIAWNEFIGGYLPLPDRATVRFTMNVAKGHWIDAELRNVDGEATFRIHADSTLVICPVASNAINVTVKR